MLIKNAASAEKLTPRGLPSDKVKLQGLFAKYNNQLTYADKILSSQNKKPLTVQQKQFSIALMENDRMRFQSMAGARIMSATNTSNIMTKQTYSDLYPLMVASLILPELAATFAMSSRKQLLPYYKFIAETDKGATYNGKVLNSPFGMQSGSDPYYGSQYSVEEALNFNGNAAMIYGSRLMPTTVVVTLPDGTVWRDDGNFSLVNSNGDTVGSVTYDTGIITADTAPAGATISYRFDNESVGRDDTEYHGGSGYLGAKVPRTRGQMDTIEVTAETYTLESDWSVLEEFDIKTQFGIDMRELSEVQNMGELAAEINTRGVLEMYQSALAEGAGSPIVFNALNGPVTFQAGPNSVWDGFDSTLVDAQEIIRQKIQTARANRLVVGSKGAAVIRKMSTFKPDSSAGSKDGMHKMGTLKDGEVDVYDASMALPVDGGFIAMKRDDDPFKASYIFGQYMPLMATQPVTLGNLSVQQGYATAFGAKVVNPATLLAIKFNF